MTPEEWPGEASWLLTLGLGFRISADIGFRFFGLGLEDCGYRV